ncbi:MAG TPA: pitrilysin family protein, partial [Gemmatimonadaceae bacterium]|nr:pitrilysin family protein [Gemmatimonadaceae bacterium]
AHLFEHMMYQGSAHVKKGEHMAMLEAAGSAGFNGSTIEDRTNYYEPLPSNRLNLGLWLEADRMRSLDISDDNVHNQREAVKEERRLRVDNQPYTKIIFEEGFKAIDSTTCYPYSHSVIGSMADLNAATTDDVRQFFKLYYAPNNATLVVTGDFEPAEAKRLIAQYFGDIPRGQPTPAVACEAKFNAGARRDQVRDPKATLPAVVKYYTIPAYDSPDYPALQLLGTIIGDGESSRLNRTLAREQKVALATQSFVNLFGPRRGPGAFVFLAIANNGVAIDTVESRLDAQISQLANGVTDEELTKAKNVWRADAIQERQRMMSLAQAIQRANLFLGDPAKLDADFDRYAAVTADDLKRVAQTYLRPENSYTFIDTAEAK